jgi:hypothetical protein
MTIYLHVNQDYGLLRCDAMKFCLWVTTFRRNPLPPTCSVFYPEDGGKIYFKMLVYVNETTWLSIPEDRSLNIRLSNNLKSHMPYVPLYSKEALIG